MRTFLRNRLVMGYVNYLYIAWISGNTRESKYCSIMNGKYCYLVLSVGDRF